MGWLLAVPSAHLVPRIELELSIPFVWQLWSRELPVGSSVGAGLSWVLRSSETEGARECWRGSLSSSSDYRPHWTDHHPLSIYCRKGTVFPRQFIYPEFKGCLHCARHGDIIRDTVDHKTGLIAALIEPPVPGEGQGQVITVEK